MVKEYPNWGNGVGSIRKLLRFLKLFVNFKLCQSKKSSLFYVLIPGGIAQWLRAFDALAEDLCSIPGSTYVAHNCLHLQFGGGGRSDTLLASWSTRNAHGAQI